MVVVLPPVSSFDVRGIQVWNQELNKLKELIGDIAEAVVDLSPALREAGKGRGEVLIQQGQQLAVFDQDTKRTWLAASPTPHDLPQEIYALFEAEPAVREALFFDDGHPDAEGFRVFAEALVPVVEPLLQGPAKSQ